MKITVIAAAVIALSGATTDTAAAGTMGTEDFFPCANPLRSQWGWPSGTDSYVVIESCRNPNTGAAMYRGNVINPHWADLLWIRYRDTKLDLAGSARSAPRDVDPNGQMPGEWYYADDYGWEIQACLAPMGSWQNKVCSQ